MTHGRLLWKGRPEAAQVPFTRRRHISFRHPLLYQLNLLARAPVRRQRSKFASVPEHVTPEVQMTIF